jgi:hypothetical protein
MQNNDIHPLRWKALTPRSGYYIDEVSRVGGNLRDQFTMEYVISAARDSYKKANAALPKDERPSFHRAGTKAAELAIFASRFFACGQNMFEASPEVGPFVGEASLGDMRWSDLRLPYKFFWLSLKNLGINEGLDGEPNTIDGVYVDATLDKLVSLVFTTRRLGVSHDVALWPRNIEDHFLMGLIKLPGDPTLEEMLQNSVEKNFVKLTEDKVNYSNFKDRPELKANGFDEEGNALYINLRTGQEMVDVERRNQLQQIDRNVKSMPAVKKALQRAVNFLAFMSMSPSERVQIETYPDDAPVELVDQAKNGRSSGARQRAQEELVMRGYSKIKVVGFTPEVSHRLASESAGRGLEFSHTRKGHARLQAYGPNRSLRKEVWIEDVKVRPDLPMHPERGHQYVVQQPNVVEQDEVLAPKI